MRLSRWLLVSILGLLLLTACHNRLSESQKLKQFFEKEKVTILVTDSGLGGLSIAADVVERMKKFKVFKDVNVVFFNAQPSLHSGYNSMKTTEQKVKVFDNALQAMDNLFKPDLLLIGCNTLSVLYDYTNFSKRASFPVKGIVGTGVDLIEQFIKKDPKAKVIIFATQTTVKQNKHKQRLIKDGIDGDRIITEACPNLAGRIERGPTSDTTRALVEKYVHEALTKLGHSSAPLLVSYNCTHYGYVDTVFKEAFKKEGKAVRAFLDPNPFMADFLFTQTYRNRYPNTKVTVKVFSQAELPPNKLKAIYGLIAPRSKQTAEALLHYTFNPNFFEWKSIVENGN